MILRRHAAGEFPAHFLYGALKFKDHGIDVIWHKSRLGLNRLQMMIRNTWRILTCGQKYDALYATHYRGIEPIVFLRALKLYRKPIVLWHHQPIMPSRSWVKSLFYKGFDELFFFSQTLINKSITANKFPANHMHLGHWGMDPVEESVPPATCHLPLRFISTGKEMRDVKTLIEAFNETGAELELFINKRNGDINYEEIISGLELKPNIHLDYGTSLAPYEISQRVAQADVVCICCQETKYTVGLTTLVEALALGKPVIASRNITYPIDIQAEGIGYLCDYGDSRAWARVIRDIMDARAITHAGAHATLSTMGQRAKSLAQTTYNDTICATEVATILKAYEREH